ATALNRRSSSTAPRMAQMIGCDATPAPPTIDLPIHHPRNAPPTPTAIVPRRPMGSRPGVNSRARAPAMRPISRTPRMFMAFLLVDEPHVDTRPRRRLRARPEARQAPGPAHDLVEHRGRELAGEGVLLAGVETPHERVRTDRDDSAVREPRLGPDPDPPGARRGQEPVPGERAERHRHPEATQDLQLAGQVREAVVPFVGRGAVARRAAPVH